MVIKNKILISFVIITLIASVSIIYTGCSKEEIRNIDKVTEPVVEIQSADEPDDESEETSSTTRPLQNFYVSSSEDFSNYSFICPEDWKLYETDSGRRVVLKNMNDGSGTENIFIFVEDISADETINGSGDVMELYRTTAIDDDTVEFFEEEDIKLDDSYSKIIGYSYQSKLDSSENEKVTYTDYFAFTEKDDFLYSIKLISSDPDREASLETLKNFIDSFSINDRVNKTAEVDENSSVNILILGDDSGMGRAGGRVNGRTDIMILLHLNLDKCEGTAVTIPRDTWVDIPGHGEGKINGAHAVGGNELTVKAVEQLSGLEIDNYIITDFDGFIPLIDFLGGVTIEVGE